MTHKKFIKELHDRGYEYEYRGKYLYITNPYCNDKMDALEELPENVIFNVDYVYLYSIKYIPKGVSFMNSSSIKLDNVISIHDSVKFINSDVYLPKLKVITNKDMFENCGTLDLSSVVSIPEGMMFSGSGNNNRTCGNITLRNIKHLAENVVFNNRGFVLLKKLEKLPSSTIIKNVGGVYMNTLTILPKNFVFENNGVVFIPQLINTIYKTLGKHTFKILKTITIKDINYYSGEVLGCMYSGDKKIGYGFIKNAGLYRNIDMIDISVFASSLKKAHNIYETLLQREMKYIDDIIKRNAPIDVTYYK